MFYKGIVEDVNDPLKIGRVKVRIIGKHIEDLSILPVDDLPWVSPIFPINSPNISGECVFSIPNQGSLVACGFYDFDEQEPFYIGTIPVISKVNPDTSKGFSDPNGIYPKSDHHELSPISKQATGTDEINRGSYNNVLFSQPASEYGAVYPDNKVITTKQGHIIEIDDSTDAERIMIYHKSGTFIEFSVNGDSVDISNRDKYIIANGNINIGSTDINEYSSENKNQTIGGNETVNIDGDKTKTIGGNETVNIDGDKIEIITGNKSETVAKLNITVNGSSIINSTGSCLIEGSSIVIKGTSGIMMVN